MVDTMVFISICSVFTFICNSQVSFIPAANKPDGTYYAIEYYYRYINQNIMKVPQNTNSCTFRFLFDLIFLFWKFKSCHQQGNNAFIYNQIITKFSQ